LLLVRYILKCDAVGSILKQTKRKHQLTIKTCTKYVDKKISSYETKSPAKNLQISSCSIATLSHALKLKSHFAAGVLGDSIRFGIFVIYQFHPGT
jgi:hypothetical protein